MLMSFRMHSWLSGVVFAIALAATAFVGCSSDDPGSDTAAAADSGADSNDSPATPAPPPHRATDSGADPTVEECLAACDTEHAAGLTKDHAIDTCWSANCQGPCIDANGPFDGGTADAGDAGDAAGDAGAPVCQNDVATGGTACDSCTKAFCCAEWDGCFGDQDCSALNACRAACYSR